MMLMLLSEYSTLLRYQPGGPGRSYPAPLLPLQHWLHEVERPSLLASSTGPGAVRQLPQLTARLQVPTLWIAGERDQVMASRYVRHLAGYAPQHEFIELAGAGHLPMGQMPKQLAAPIQQWLSQLPSSQLPGSED